MDTTTCNINLKDEYPPVWILENLNLVKKSVFFHMYTTQTEKDTYFKIRILGRSTNCKQFLFTRISTSD